MREEIDVNLRECAMRLENAFEEELSNEAKAIMPKIGDLPHKDAADASVVRCVGVKVRGEVTDDHLVTFAKLINYLVHTKLIGPIILANPLIMPMASECLSCGLLYANILGFDDPQKKHATCRRNGNPLPPLLPRSLFFFYTKSPLSMEQLNHRLSMNLFLQEGEVPKVDIDGLKGVYGE